ncbi:hypothetical protein Cal6303_1735 [Calothrix sp. PCC 6303]|nr:hypothetical protein Cal6303_1735 [Calothrix sp. PCC 6303]
MFLIGSKVPIVGLVKQNPTNPVKVGFRSALTNLQYIQVFCVDSLN